MNGVKVKILDNVLCSDRFEDKINDFIKDKDIIDIKFQTCSSGGFSTKEDVLIIYKENSNGKVFVNNEERTWINTASGGILNC